jgi:hypothetical protein
VPNPIIKKDANGMYVIEGALSNGLSQQQLDYNEIYQKADLISGPEGDAARKNISANPNISAGIISGLYKSGTIGSSQLTSTLAEIDKQTKAQRELDQNKESQRLANEGFKKQFFGIPYNVWNSLKSVSRLAVTVSMAPVEAVLNTGANLVASVATGKPVNAVWEGIDQTNLVQGIKELIKTRKLDVGSGFFINEESGVGLRVRKEKLKSGKILVLDGEGQEVKDKEGNTLYRPYSAVDPLSYIMTGGHLESGTARFINAIGEVGLMIYTDPVTKVNKLLKVRDLIVKSENYAKGRTSAQDLQRLTVLDGEIQTKADETAAALKELEIFDKNPALKGIVSPKQQQEMRVAWENKQEELIKLETEYDGLGKVKQGLNYDNIATFLSGKSMKPVIDEIADTNDYLKIWEISRRGEKPGFTIKQAQELAAAKTREEVLGAIAPYIASGSVVQNILETGTKASRGLSKIIPGSVAKPAQDIVGWATKGVKKIPYAEKVYNDLSKSYTTYIPKQGTLVHYNDKDALVESVIGFARATKVDEVTIRKLVDDLVLNINAKTSAYDASIGVFKAVFAANAAAFAKAGISTDKLTELTTAFKKGADEQSKYWAEMHVNGANIDFVRANGSIVKYSGPHLESERLKSMVYFPPPQELINEIAKVSKFKGIRAVRNNKLGNKSIDLVDSFTSGYWKKVILTRPAYVIRNIGEEQIRIMLNGHMSFYNNPLAAMGMWLGRSEGPQWKQLLNSQDQFKHNVFKKDFKMATSGEELAMETIANGPKNTYIGVMGNPNAGSRLEVGKVAVMRGYEEVRPGDPRYFLGLANEIRILNQDPMAKLAISTIPGAEANTVEFLLSGAGRPTLDSWLSGVYPLEDRAFWGSREGIMTYLFTGKDKNLKSVSMRDRIAGVAGQDGASAAAITKLIGDGFLETSGYSLKVPKEADDALNSIKNAKEVSAGRKQIKDANEEFADQLKLAFNGQGNWGNVVQKVPKTEISISKRKKNIIENFFDHAVEFDKTTSFGPEWRMSYWDAVSSVIMSADTKALKQIKEIAPKSLKPLVSENGKSKIGMNHSFWKKSTKADGSGNMTVEEIHEYASRVASNDVKELFYDASKKRLLWHQLRIIAPFAQAWENTLTKWGKLSLDNPGEIYKISRGIEWLNSSESSSLYEATDAKSYYDPNQGFFFTNPQTNQRQFFVPFMSTGMNFMTSLTRKVLTGQGEISTSGPFGQKASPQSFNFALGAGVLPGFGPGLTIGLNVLDGFGVNPVDLLPGPWQETVNKIVFPFGKPNLETTTGLVSTLTTNNIGRLFAGVTGTEDGYASSFAPVMNYLASSGDYNLDDPVDQNRLTKDTDKFARFFSISRGVFGLGSPVALTPEDLVLDKTGNTVLAAALYKDFEDILNSNSSDRNKSYADFLDLYGPEQVFALIGSYTGGPVNLATYQKILNDPTVADVYPDTYGYFYPNGGFSLELRKWQEREGKIERLSAQEIFDRATNIRFAAAKDRVLTRSIAEGWDSKYTAATLSNLSDSYNLKGKKTIFDASREDRILNQLRDATQDSRFDDSEAVTGMRDYLYLRDKALEVVGKKSNDSLSADKYEEQRKFLAEQALEIIKRNPDFQKIYYSFFKKELEGN